MNKKVLLASAFTLPMIAFAGLGIASAATDTTGQDGFAGRFATKFNLNKDDVSSFMTADRAARQAEREVKVADALKAAGFSDAQVAALKTKRAEQRTAHQAWHTANPNATQAQNQSQRDAEKVAFEAWAKDQGIDLAKVKTILEAANLSRGGKGGHKGRAF